MLINQADEKKKIFSYIVLNEFEIKRYYSVPYYSSSTKFDRVETTLLSEAGNKLNS